jgi:hypothetical protein
VIAEILIALVANSVRFPKGLYLVPVGGLLVVLGITVTVDLLRDSASQPLAGRNGLKTGADIGSASVNLYGRRLRSTAAQNLSTFALLIGAFLALVALAMLASHKHPLIMSVLGSIAIVLIVIGTVFAVGIRARIGFSPSGIRIRDERGEFAIRWDETIDVYTRTSWGAIWMIADLPPKSPLRFHGPWTLDRSGGDAIRICDLRQYRIEKDRVDAAIDFYDPR